MLIFSTKPDPSYLIKLAEKLLKLNATEFDEVLSLVEMAGMKDATWSIRLSIANACIRQGRNEKAKKLLCDINVQNIYAENSKLKDIHARIGWALYWPEKDYRSVIEWFEKDLLWPEKQNQILESRSDLFTGRLSPAWRLNYAQALAANGEIVLAERQVEIAYVEDPTLKDGFSRIGWNLFSEKKNYKTVYRLIKRDDDNRRQSPAWRVNQAIVVAKTEGLEAALPIIEKAYDEDLNLNNAYSRVAWARYIPEDMAYEKMMPYFEKDIRYQRLSGEWQINYAKTLLIMGRKKDAITQIDDAYQNNPSLTNGYAGAAFLRHFICDFEPGKALPWFEKDFKLGRIDKMALIYRAYLFAAMGNIDTAESHIDQAYTQDQRLNNGYGLVGWYYYALLKKDFIKALEFFRRDEQLRRLHSNAVNLYAGVYACLGERLRAERMVAENYANDSTAIGGNLILGICDYNINKDIGYVYKMVECDMRLKRLPLLPLYAVYAAILLKYGNTSKAIECIKISSERSGFAYNFAVSWLNRICSETERFYLDFFSHELFKMFSNACKSKIM